MSGLKELLNDEQGFKSDAKEKLDKKAFEKLADMKANIAKDFIMPEVAETDKEETKTDEQS
tara:strand:- start:2851 stop:3033 length:183 start_codon:yes stop_codon:yes gene_type:complete